MSQSKNTDNTNSDEIARSIIQPIVDQAAGDTKGGGTAHSKHPHRGTDSKNTSNPNKSKKPSKVDLQDDQYQKSSSNRNIVFHPDHPERIYDLSSTSTASRSPNHTPDPVSIEVIPPSLIPMPTSYQQDIIALNDDNTNLSPNHQPKDNTNGASKTTHNNTQASSKSTHKKAATSTSNERKSHLPPQSSVKKSGSSSNLSREQRRERRRKLEDPNCFPKRFEVQVQARVRVGQDLSSQHLTDLPEGSVVTVEEIVDRRARISRPLCGWLSVTSKFGARIILPTNSKYSKIGGKVRFQRPIYNGQQTAKVVDYNEDNSMYKISYEDGHTQWVDFEDPNIQFISQHKAVKVQKPLDGAAPAFALQTSQAFFNQFFCKDYPQYQAQSTSTTRHMDISPVAIPGGQSRFRGYPSHGLQTNNGGPPPGHVGPPHYGVPQGPNDPHRNRLYPAPPRGHPQGLPPGGYPPQPNAGMGAPPGPHGQQRHPGGPGPYGPPPHHHPHRAPPGPQPNGHVGYPLPQGHHPHTQGHPVNNAPAGYPPQRPPRNAPQPPHVMMDGRQQTKAAGNTAKNGGNEVNKKTNEEFVNKVKEIERRIIQHLHQRGYDESHPDYHRYLQKAKELAIQKAGKEREKMLAQQRERAAQNRGVSKAEYEQYMRYKQEKQRQHAIAEQQRKQRIEAQQRAQQQQAAAAPSTSTGGGKLTSPSKSSGSVKGLIVLRGLPGSGKTTLAKKLAQRSKNARICTEDRYHWSGKEDGVGEYKFQPQLVFLAREWCTKEIRECIQSNVNLIILDNHNARISMYEDHIQYAVEHGYRFRIIEFVATASLIDKYRARSYKKFPREVYVKLLKLWEHDPRTELINPTFGDTGGNSKDTSGSGNSNSKTKAGDDEMNKNNEDVHGKDKNNDEMNNDDNINNNQ